MQSVPRHPDRPAVARTFGICRVWGSLAVSGFAYFVESTGISLEIARCVGLATPDIRVGDCPSWAQHRLSGGKVVLLYDTDSAGDVGRIKVRGTVAEKPRSPDRLVEENHTRRRG